MVLQGSLSFHLFVERRFAIRFTVQLIFTGLILVGLAICITVWILNKLEEIEINRNFAPLVISRLISDAEVNSQGLIVDEELIKRLQADGGWLQSLDSNGNVLQSFNVPDHLPTHYIPGQLIIG